MMGLDSLYNVKPHERAFWGDHWVGPEKYVHGQEALIAEFPKTHEDGFTVRIFAIAMPARFYKIVGEDGTRLQTGSGDENAYHATTIAKLIAAGNLGAGEKEA
jgi:hypothetical protein